MKWFTYCGNDSTHTNRRSRRHHESVIHERNHGSSDVGLLLHSDDEEDPITSDDIKLFMQDTRVSELFPLGVYAIPAETEGDFVVTPSLEFSSLPDQATAESQPLRILYDGGTHDISLRRRYNDCRELVKAIGCSQCPKKGVVCLTETLGVIGLGNELSRLTNTDNEDLQRELKNRKTKIGSFTYISPKLTVPEHHYFVPSFRHIDDHDFSRIDDISKEIGDQNSINAEAARFKKTQCGGCPLKGSCKNYRTCRGAYPTNDVIAEQVLADWLPKIKEGPFEEWQFWALARAGNIRTKYARKEICLHGLVKKSKGWVVTLWRTKCHIGEIAEINSYTELLKLFPHLPENEKRAKEYTWGRPDNDIITALYLKLVDYNSPNIYRNRGWGHSNGDLKIVSKRLDDHCVRVRFGYGRYEHTYKDAELKTFKDFYDSIDHKLGINQACIRPTAYAAD